jgi:hypothetical protein
VSATLDDVDNELKRTQTTLDAILAQLDDAWSSPCLAHVARFFPRPRISTIDELRGLWSSGLRGIRSMIGGLYVRDGVRYLYVPPTTPPEPDDDARRELEPWRCHDAAPTCGHVGTFMARAEKAFDEEEVALRSRSPWKVCSSVRAFETWAQCVASETPRTYRYTRTMALRAPSRGWFILRRYGGDYDSAD